MSIKSSTAQKESRRESEPFVEPFVPPETPDSVPDAEHPPGTPEAIDKDFKDKPAERE